MAVNYTEELKKKLEAEKNARENKDKNVSDGHAAGGAPKPEIGKVYYKGEDASGKQKKPKKQVKLMGAAVPFIASGALWFLLALAMPIYKLGTVIFVSILAWLLYFILNKIRNRQLKKIPPAPVKKTYTDEMATRLYNLSDLVIDKATMIKSESMRDNLSSIAITLSKMAEEVENDPKDRNKVRKLGNYYGDMLLGLLDKYINLQKNELKDHEGENVSGGMERIEEAVKGIDVAIKKLLDNLFKDDNMEINAEINTLDSLMRLEIEPKAHLNNEPEGLTPNETLEGIFKQSENDITEEKKEN